MTLIFGKKKIAGGAERLYKLIIQSVELCWRSSQSWRRTAGVLLLSMTVTNRSRSPICEHDLDFREVYHWY